jgi:uncharacterized membrane protein
LLVQLLPLSELDTRTKQAVQRPFRVWLYLREGWRIYAQYPGAFTLFTLLIGTKALLLAVLGEVFPLFVPISYLDSFINDPALYAGYLTAAHAIATDRQRLGIGFGVFWQGYGRMARHFGVLMTQAPWLYVGLLLGGLPALVVLAVFLLAKPLVQFIDCDSAQALRASFRALRGKWAMAMVFLLLLALILAAGVLLLGVGLLVAVPWVYCAVYAAFRHQFMANTE